MFRPAPVLPFRLTVVNCVPWKEEDFSPLLEYYLEEVAEDMEWQEKEEETQQQQKKQQEKPQQPKKRKNYHSRVLSCLRQLFTTTTTRSTSSFASPRDLESFVKFNAMFQQLLNQKHVGEKEKEDQLIIAIEELDDSAEFVATLREELDGMKPILERKNKNADTMMKEAKTKRKELQTQMNNVKMEEMVVENTITEIKQLESSCKQQLALAMPPLEKAVRVIKSLKKSDLDEVKSMKNPPGKVKMTMEVICLMLGKLKVIGWKICLWFVYDCVWLCMIVIVCDCL